MLHKEFRSAFFLFAGFALVGGACTGSVGQAGGESGGDRGGGGGGDSGGGGGTVEPNPPGACRVAVPMRRLTEVQYRNAIRDIFQGQATLPKDFAIPTLGAPTSGFTTDTGYNAVDLGVARELNDAAITIPLSVVDKLSTLLPCASTPNEACAQTFIDTYGRRAYRRPLLDSEKATLLKAFKLGTGTDAFKDGIAAVVATILNSPEFTYQTEAGSNSGAEVLALTSYEVASRLSFLLWDSVPDDALLDAAAAGKLNSANDIRAQADRLLGDPKARATIARFVSEWAHFKLPAAGQRADKLYTAELATAMQSEFEKFAADSFLSDGKTLKTFLTSDAPFANPTLDAFIKANGGYTGRSGLLTQPALLTGLASSTDTSPIRRSVFVRTKLTCEAFPAPPNDALTVETGLTLPADATQRQRSTVRVANPRCGGCHHLIDPLGFGFEAFDELGRFRQKAKDGSAIDASGEFVEPASKELEGKFTSLNDLGGRLAESPAVHECLSRQLFRFSYARTDGDADSCSIQGVAKKFADSGLGLRDLVMAVVTADEFRFRRVQ
ncbi:MAG: DUF1592 domain-containing protein [Deltaproteobacteria bacterium]|nr:DUF1592 domain-containing protein [Deltaproteobacteria bacterium]